MKENKTLFMAKGGIITALGVILIYLSSIVPGNKLFLLSIASCLIPIAVITTNLKNSFIIYISTLILAFLMTGLTTAVIAYAFFFGIYGLVKYYIEKIGKLPIEFLLKIAFFNVCFYISYNILKLFLPSSFNFKLSIFIFIIGAEFIFLFYDYFLTVMIAFINKRLIKKSK
jgi:hypothetical protein